MYLLKPFLVALSAITACEAFPALQTRDITTEALSSFDFWVQYAAASYCEPNYVGKAGSKLTCWAKNCPSVEESETSIMMDFSNTTNTDTSGYLAIDVTHKAIVLAFRGSYSVRNWLADATFIYTNPNLCSGCEAELGFWSSWINVRANITTALAETVTQYPDYSLVVVGHSLGAAVATLAAADLREQGYVATLYAFASPRVANPTLAKYITNQNKGANFRFTHTTDPVPNLPLQLMGYAHVSPEYHITAPNNATVNASAVVVYQNGDDPKGNTGALGIPDLLTIDAHHWYFERTDGCLGPGMPFKRSN
ncbi:mono and diacylglycerol lipase [Aspergillus heteromorphus CBS 117.55]|uniref:feruloyl esterase n=1 Tax=Aspergillus heteromorphus CBS 117.55 TaxID=1448321 RepID=A0A317VIZ8_9EURO|nr:mono and diacylglycerol lipase [Aspergillus heteromorphus CBS 117.55]PWY73008.1 mono and diacylglycerol lipase [Aspergillus heteromorphus CBS 117.55]